MATGDCVWLMIRMMRCMLNYRHECIFAKILEKNVVFVWLRTLGYFAFFLTLGCCSVVFSYWLFFFIASAIGLV